MIFAPTRTSDSIWLATTPVDPDGKTGMPCTILPALILRHLRESGENASLEWVVDAEPGGRLRSWLRVGPADEDGLATIGEAAEMPLVSGDCPPTRDGSAEPLPIQLGFPIAVLAHQPPTVHGFLARVRWLAERGLGVRLQLNVHQLTPGRRVVQAVQTARETAMGGFRRWDLDRDRVLHAERLLRGVIFQMTLTPDRPLRAAERTLLSQALADTFTRDAVLGGRAAPALAEESLAEALIGEFASACPATVRTEDEADLADLEAVQRRIASRR
jgi:hypothetical protein